jgi:tetratricopeptide (TPR) repeat protein
VYDGVQIWILELSGKSSPTRKRGLKPKGPVPLPVPEEDVISPARFSIGNEIDKLLFGRFGFYLVVALVALVVFYAAGWLLKAAMRPVLRICEEHQAAKLVRIGGDYMAQGDLAGARMSAETSLRLIPENADGLRLLAGIFEREGRPGQAFEVYQRLSRTGMATISEFKQLAEAASKNGYTDMANSLADWVGQQGEPDFPHQLKASALLVSGQNAEALKELRRAWAASRSNRARRELARFLLAYSEHGESDAEVHSLLEEIARSDDALGHEALVVGILSGVVPLEKRPDWLQRLRSHPLASEGSFAIADAVEVAADSSAKPRIVDALIQRVYAQSIGDRLIAARWLLRHDEAARIPEILPLEQVSGNSEAFSLWIEAQAAQGLWPAVLVAVAENPHALPPAQGRLLYGQALKKTGKSEEGRVQYRQALAEMKGNTGLLLPALAFLWSDGEEDLFREHAIPLLSNEATAIGAVQSIGPEIRQAGSAAALRSFLQLASDTGPLANYSILLNEVAYLDLVLGRPVDHAAIAQRAANFPDIHSFRFTWALSELLQGRKAKALLIVENPKLRARDLASEHQLILECILATNGQTEQASQVAKLLILAPLTQEERQLESRFQR